MPTKGTSYKMTALYACKEHDIAEIANMHSKSLRELDPTTKVNSSKIDAYWRGIMQKLHDPAIKLTVFKAVSGRECIGIGFATANRLRENDLKSFGGQICLIRVLKKAQRCGIGRRLLSCLTANLYSFGIKNAFMVIDKDSVFDIGFVKAMNARSLLAKDDVIIFGWDDLPTIFNYRDNPRLW